MKYILLLILFVSGKNFCFSQELFNDLFSKTKINITSNILDEALQKCDSILLSDPENVDVIYSKAMIFYYLQQFADSRQQMEMVLKVDSGKADIHFNIATTYINEFEKLLFIPRYSNPKFSNEKPYWECSGQESDCLNSATTIYPYITRFLELEKGLKGEDSLLFNDMRESLKIYIEERK